MFISSDSEKETSRAVDGENDLAQDESALLEERGSTECVPEPTGSPVSHPISDDAIEVELMNNDGDATQPAVDHESETEMELDNLF